MERAVLIAAVLTAAGLSAATAGCEPEPQVRVEVVPKTGGAAGTGGGAGQPPAASPAESRTTLSPGLSGTVPDAWQPAEAGGQMVLARWNVVPDDEAVQVSLTRFPGDVGGELANVNRWRRQAGLGPVQSVEEQPAFPLPRWPAEGREAKIFHVNGPAEGGTRIVVALLPVPAEDATWFVRLSGPAEAVAPHVPAFVDFIASLQPSVEQER